MGIGSMKSIYELGALSKEFQTERLGCAMVATTRPYTDINSLEDAAANEYYSIDRERYKHITGIQDKHHTTVRYGFLPGVSEELMIHVAKHCPSVQSLSFEIMDVEVFDSKIPTEDYECAVALLRPTGVLLELHEQFGVLPNLMTFPYKPHVTIGYFKTGYWEAEGVFNFNLRAEVIATRWEFSTARVLDNA